MRELAVDHAPFDPADRDVLFELSLDDALSTSYDDGTPVRRHWVRGDH